MYNAIINTLTVLLTHNTCLLAQSGLLGALLPFVDKVMLIRTVSRDFFFENNVGDASEILCFVFLSYYTQ